MDACSGKRTGGVMKSKKGYTVGLKDSDAERDQNIQFCCRIGCSGRIKYSQNTKIGTSDISKCSKPSLRSLNRNKTYGNSCRGNSVITSAKELISDSMRKVSSQLESYPSGGGISGDSEALDPTPLPNTSPTGKLTVTETGSSSASSSIRPQKISLIRSGLHKPIALPASSIPSVSKSPNQGPSKDGCGSRYGLKSLTCNSIPDVIPSSISSFSKSVRKNLMDRKIPERESCMSSRKTTTASSIDGNISPSNCSISICDSRNSNRASGEVNNGVSSFRTQRAVNINSWTRLSSGPNMMDSSSATKPVSGCPQFPQSGTPNNGGSNSSQHFSANVFSNGSSSCSLSSCNDGYQSTLMPLTSGELGFIHFMSYDALQRCNIDGIAEVQLLLALERIERDEELTHEQILALDSSLFLGSLNIHDQHRDMRLDIDNMSYEELLALEDRMGSVSTAVPEEALTKYLRRSIYQVTSSEVQVSRMDEGGDDIKCCICQEDFALGDENGALVECEHEYHITCIYQWLQLKNWCPICKVAAAPSESSSA